MALTNVSIPLRSAIELSNPLDAESLLELVPYLRTKTVPKHHSNVMLSIERPRWLSEQVATDFADVLTNLHHEHHTLAIVLLIAKTTVILYSTSS